MDNLWHSSQGPFDLNDDSQASDAFLNDDSVPLGAFLNNPLFSHNNSAVPYPPFAHNTETVPLVHLDDQSSPIAQVHNRTHTQTPFFSQAQYETPPSTNRTQSRPPTKSKAKGKKKGVVAESRQSGSHRSSNYTRDEDLCLISTWLNVSKDSAVGTNQTHDAYWDCILHYYQQYKPEYSERNKKSLQHRWDTISSAVSKFVGFKAQRDRLNESGKTQADRYNEAVALFESQEGKPKWVFQHCWEVLRHSKKWEDYRLNREEQAEEFEGLNIIGEGSGQPSDSKRPMGRDAAKKRKSGAQSDSESQCVEILQHIMASGDVRHEAMATDRLERSANQKAKLEVLQHHAQLKSRQVAMVEAKEQRKQLAEDRSIMDVDLSTLSGPRRDFYEAMQHRILSKYGINPNQGPSA